MLLYAKNIVKSYPEGEGRKLSVLTGLNITVSESDIVAITGESGVGKSTLLHVLGLLDKQDEGEIFFKEKATHNLNERERSKIRNTELGFVFQFHHLLPEFTALENVALPARIAGFSENESLEKANELLRKVGLSERGSHYPNALSGGEQQRVALARALVCEPSLLLADEPTGNLDEKNARIMAGLLLNLASEKKLGVIIATHNRELAASAKSVMLLKNGTLNDITDDLTRMPVIAPNGQNSVGQTFPSVPSKNEQAGMPILQTGLVGQTFLSVHGGSPGLRITKRKLPHWTMEGSVYFVTAALYKTKLSDEEKKIVFDHILEGSVKYYSLFALTVMADEIYLILKPLADYTLSRIMKGIKGATAHAINKLRGFAGSIWQSESSDRIIRNEAEFEEKVNYIRNKSTKADSVDTKRDYPFLFIEDQEQAGMPVIQREPVGQTFLSVPSKNEQAGMPILPSNPVGRTFPSDPPKENREAK